MAFPSHSDFFRLYVAPDLSVSAGPLRQCCTSALAPDVAPIESGVLPHDGGLTPIKALTIAMDERDTVSGESILVLSRIVAIVETYDAMGRTRLYGQPLGHAEIMRELQRVAGTQHDPYLTHKFAEIIDASPFKTA